MDRDNSMRRWRDGAAGVDPLGLYLREMAGCRFLTVKEERSLVAKYRQGVSAQQRLAKGRRDTRIIRLARDGEEAGRALVEAHLPMVVAAARVMYAKNRQYVALEDLISAGNEGLLVALRHFDPHRQRRFSAYAKWWVRYKMGLEVRQGRWMIRIPDSIYRRLFPLLRVADRLSKELGRTPTTRELAAAAESGDREVRSILVWATGDVLSLDMPVGENGHSTLGDFLADDRGLPGHDASTEPPQAASDEALHEQIMHFLSELLPRERRVIVLRFGVEDGEARSLFEVGLELHVTGERVRQIEAKALRKLRHPSRSKYLRGFLE